MKAKFLTIFLVLLMSIGAMGLTPRERTIVKHAQEHLYVAGLQFNAAQAHAKAADDAMVEANRHLATAEKEVKDAHQREINLAKDNDKMRPVYLKVTSKWGLGAIFFGIALLLKHLLILGLVILSLMAALYALSFMFPVIGVAVKAIAVFIHMVGGWIHTVGTHLHFHGNQTPV